MEKIGTNTLAYFGSLSATEKESVYIALAPGLTGCSWSWLSCGSSRPMGAPRRVTVGAPAMPVNIG
jgi:hypothetical protein